MKHKTFITLAVLAAFIWCNWATSEPEETVALNMSTSLNNSVIILRNDGEINVEAADVLVTDQVRQYNINDYNLLAGATDTIPFGAFESTDSITLTSGAILVDLQVYFWKDNINYTYEHNF